MTKKDPYFLFKTLKWGSFLLMTFELVMMNIKNRYCLEKYVYIVKDIIWLTNKLSVEFLFPRH